MSEPWSAAHREVLARALTFDLPETKQLRAIRAGVAEIDRLEAEIGSLIEQLAQCRRDYDARLADARRAAFDEILARFGRQWWDGIGMLEALEALRDDPQSSLT